LSDGAPTKGAVVVDEACPAALIPWHSGQRAGARHLRIDGREWRRSAMVQELRSQDPGVPMNCPWCGLPLLYVGSAERGPGDLTTVHVYDCKIDGRIYLTEDQGFSRRRPPGWLSY
jgi:hypothetical protein